MIFILGRPVTRIIKDLAINVWLITAMFSSVVVAKPLPELVVTDTQTQLLVEGKPYLILGGELGNSSASSMAYMEPIWPKLKAMNVNTLLAPVYWENIEPVEGQFDFLLVKKLVERARAEKIKVVLLWFGSWKNSMSSYVPSWVKGNTTRFERSISHEGKPQEILAALSTHNAMADANAFENLMAFLKKIDGKHRTVIMVQVENEIGMLPSARDHSAAATEAYHQPVPTALMDYLLKHKSTLTPSLLAAWKSSNYAEAGRWEEVFGVGIATEEIFTAWHFARYTNVVATAGKKRYPLPMFVNAALNRPNVLPGDYPSGGPLPHLMDVWKAGAPAIDLLVPDFYNPRFQYWNDLYTQQGDALLIPEIRFTPEVGAKALFAFGHYNTLGFSPFSIESTATAKAENLTHSYNIIHQLQPLITQHQGSDAIAGVWLTKEQPETTRDFGDYRFTIKHDLTLGWNAASKAPAWDHSGAIIIQTGEHDFYVGGSGVVITFSHPTKQQRVGIETLYEGVFIGREWQAGRRLNGDQSHQGRHLRLPYQYWGLQQLRLYSY